MVSSVDIVDGRSDVEGSTSALLPCRVMHLPTQLGHIFNVEHLDSCDRIGFSVAVEQAALWLAGHLRASTVDSDTHVAQLDS